MTLVVWGVEGIGEVVEGADLADVIARRVDLLDGDVVVVAQKVVSKAEGRAVGLRPGEPLAAARRRLTLEQAVQVLVDVPGVLVVRTSHGLVCANAGIDASNVPEDRLLLLPLDPDASAARIREALVASSGARVAVVVTDTFGRAWRDGQVDVAIGSAGLAAIRDERTDVDRHGRPLEVTRVAVLDELAAAADLVRRKADGVPVVVIRGADLDVDEEAGARQLARDVAGDLFPRGRGAVADALAAPVALRALDDLDVRRAVTVATSVVAGRVVVEVDEGDPTVLRPVPRQRDATLADLAAAAATAYAALVDAGGAPRLELGAAPLVRVARRPPTGA